mgnify:CR=1 FL=1
MPRMTSTCNFCWGEDIENGLATREETPNHNRLVYPVYDNHRLFVFYACRVGTAPADAATQLLGIQQLMTLTIIFRTF